MAAEVADRAAGNNGGLVGARVTSERGMEDNRRKAVENA